MNGYNSLTNPNSIDNHAASPSHKHVPLNLFQVPQQPFNNVYQSGNFENESYRFFYNNPYQTQISNSVQNKNSIFLAYLQTKISNFIGPVLINLSGSNNNTSGEPFTLEFNFLNEEGQYLDETPNKIFQLKEIQAKFESLLQTKNIFNKNEFNNFQEFLKEMYACDSLNFQVVQLPFDQFKISTENNKKYRNVETSSQTTNLQEKLENSKVDYLNFMKQEIQLLKEQNQLLKHQLEIKSKETSNPPIKEYVLRKNSTSTKESRNPSATSTVMNMESCDSNSPIKNISTSATSNNEGTAFYEILQEYMLENEALRLQNISLNELRVRHHSEIEFVFKQNQNLTEKVKELTRQISQMSVRNSENIAPEVLNNSTDLQKEQLMDQGYPITYERQQFISEKNSYLKQYDNLKHKYNSDKVYKKGNQPTARNEKNPSPERPTHNPIKPEINQSNLNDSLKEELGRIDNTIKEHIRKTQFNDTLRNMGAKHIFSRK